MDLHDISKEQIREIVKFVSEKNDGVQSSK